MSNLIKCDTCNGRKKMLGAGMLEKECAACSGVGWVRKVEEEPITSVEITTKEADDKPMAKKRKYTKRK